MGKLLHQAFLPLRRVLDFRWWLDATVGAHLNVAMAKLLESFYGAYNRLNIKEHLHSFFRPTMTSFFTANWITGAQLCLGMLFLN